MSESADPRAARRKYEREWYANNREKYLGYKAAWKKAHPEYRLNESQKAIARRRERRLLAIEALGGGCGICGFTDERALEFDHKQPERRGTGKRPHCGALSPAEFQLVIDGNPHNIQVLCSNCHAIKSSIERAARPREQTELQRSVAA